MNTAKQVKQYNIRKLSIAIMNIIITKKKTNDTMNLLANPVQPRIICNPTRGIWLGLALWVNGMIGLGRMG